MHESAAFETKQWSCILNRTFRKLAASSVCLNRDSFVIRSVEINVWFNQQVLLPASAHPLCSNILVYSVTMSLVIHLYIHNNQLLE